MDAPAIAATGISNSVWKSQRQLDDECNGRHGTHCVLRSHEIHVVRW